MENLAYISLNGRSLKTSCMHFFCKKEAMENLCPLVGFDAYLDSYFPHYTHIALNFLSSLKGGLQGFWKDTISHVVVQPVWRPNCRRSMFKFAIVFCDSYGEIPNFNNLSRLSSQLCQSIMSSLPLRVAFCRSERWEHCALPTTTSIIMHNGV